MADPIVWPTCVLKPAAAQLSLAAMTTSGGASPTGSEQVVGNSPGRVKIALNNIPIRNREQVRCWRAIDAALGGRAGTIMVPVYDKSRGPFPTVAGQILYTYGDISFGDGALFDDGSGFYQPVIIAVMASPYDVAPGAVTMPVQVDYGAELEAGMVFSAGEYVYVISQILSVDDTDGNMVYSIAFRPPAREVIAADASLDFDNPAVRCRLASDDGMALPALDLWKTADASVSFVEDV